MEVDIVRNALNVFIRDGVTIGILLQELDEVIFNILLAVFIHLLDVVGRIGRQK